MNWLDYVLLAIIAVTAVVGVFRGFEFDVVPDLTGDVGLVERVERSLDQLLEMPEMRGALGKGG